MGLALWCSMLKLPPTTLTTESRVLVQAQLLHFRQLLANASGKAAEASLSVSAAATHVQDPSGAQGGVDPSHSRGNLLESHPAILACLCLALSL